MFPILCDINIARWQHFGGLSSLHSHTLALRDCSSENWDEEADDIFALDDLPVADNSNLSEAVTESTLDDIVGEIEFCTNGDVLVSFPTITSSFSESRLTRTTFRLCTEAAQINEAMIHLSTFLLPCNNIIVQSLRVRN